MLNRYRLLSLLFCIVFFFDTLYLQFCSDPAIEFTGLTNKLSIRKFIFSWLPHTCTISHNSKTGDRNFSNSCKFLIDQRLDRLHIEGIQNGRNNILSSPQSFNDWVLNILIASGGMILFLCSIHLSILTPYIFLVFVSSRLCILPQ